MSIMLTSMKPEARDAMEEALAKYEEHVKGIRSWKKGHRGNVYSFAYWLFRYSGLVSPTARTTK